jgi:RNA polymerase sigma-70 factor (family 1)
MNSSFSDSEIVERLQKGDVEAFDMLYEKYSGKLYAFSLKYLRSVHESEELVQSVFLKCWENHRSLRKESSFKSYLFTIAYNDICKIFRKREYHRKFLEDIMHKNTESSSESEDSIYFQSVMERLQQIIDRIPERQKTIFLKSRQEGKSTKEIAKEVGLSPGTVDNYISESLKYIRSHLLNKNLLLLLFVLSIFVMNITMLS